MKKPIYADFMETDYKGRLVLTSDRTFGDLAETGAFFEEGTTVMFYTEDLDAQGNRSVSVVEGLVEYDLDAERWVAKINWSEIKSAAQLSADEKAELGLS